MTTHQHSRELGRVAEEQALRLLLLVLEQEEGIQCGSVYVPF